MIEIRKQWTDFVRQTVERLMSELDIDAELASDSLVAETPPNSELGDIAFPLFPLARVFRRNPAEIAERVADMINARGGVPGNSASSSREGIAGEDAAGDDVAREDAAGEDVAGDDVAREDAAGKGVAGKGVAGEASAAGPYLNIKLDRPALIRRVLRGVSMEGAGWVRSGALEGSRFMVEFSCPNTNKPLHLGHLRNDALGESVSRLLEAAGASVRRVNLINDRGIHICQSMLAYRELGQGQTPESTGRKSDHFVGDWYVEFHRLSERDPAAKDRASELLRRWEQGDPEVVELWNTMNRWAIDGIQETYRATGVRFDAVYYESDTYRSGREEILAGLERGVFYRDDEGAVWVDLEDVGLDRKVLLRADGTSLYVTQDIGTAIARYRDWPFDRLIYVVASEQRYHFSVLFTVLGRLGYEWAGNLFHLSYGMVNLPEGRMKSRQGTVVDADDLLADLSDLARSEIVSKGREAEVEDIERTSRDVAVGALHYYLLSTSPNKDMVFDPSESISFTGNTGPYVQYMGARISSMIRKSRGYELLPIEEIDVSLLSQPEEWDLLKAVADMPATVASAAAAYNPSIVVAALYELAKQFSRYYHDHPILTAEDTGVRSARMALAHSVVETLKGTLPLIGVPFLERM